MASTLEQRVKEDLGEKAWILLCQQQRIAELEAALAEAQRALAERQADPA